MKPRHLYITLFLSALLPLFLHAQRATVTIPAGSEIAIIAGAQLCADTIYAYGTLTTANAGNLCGPVVPVELLALTVDEERGMALLRWSTAAESGNYGFDVQRSEDGAVWRSLAFVRGGGTSAERRDYAYDDPLADLRSRCDVLYYRLRQVDFDGKESVSPAVELRLAGAPASPRILAPYPNPARDELVVPIALGSAQPVSVTVYDAAGRAVLHPRRGELLDAGYHALRVNTSGWESGTYLVEMTAGTERRTQVVAVRR